MRLDVAYDYDLAAAHLREVPSVAREHNVWRYEELLPIRDARIPARVGWHTGYTPLIHAKRLGAELGLNRLYLKDDSASYPSLSYKDRVACMAVARLLEGSRREIGCVSTGNVGAAVASLAAQAGITTCVFFPTRLEATKARLTHALGARVAQIEGDYDEVSCRCREIAEMTGVEFANITLRPFYAEGAKTVAFEIVEQLDWDSPDHIVVPAASGTLASGLHKGLTELELVELAETHYTKLHIAQPQGSNTIAAAILAAEAEIRPVTPWTPGDPLTVSAPGESYDLVDAVRKRGGTSDDANDREIFSFIELLAATEGILTEPAGGVTIAVLEKLAAAGRFRPEETVVATITGNGIKTLDDHPSQPWPEKIPCDVEAMMSVILDFEFGEVAVPA